MAEPAPVAHRILVADDNVEIAQALEALLSAHGFTVEIAYDGQQAVDIAARFQPELVILDIKMPVMNGYEAARVLSHAKTGKDKIMLLALTGFSGEQSRDEAHAAGFDVVVPKPVDGNYLCDLIQGFLDTHSADAAPGDPLDRVLTRDRASGPNEDL